MKKEVLTSILFLFIASLAISNITSAYTFISKIQDDGTINHYAKPPSFYWGGSCVLSSTLFISANSSSYPYTANHNWYMPDATNVQYSNPIYNSNLVCLNAGTYTASSPLNSFYESKTSSTSSATIKTWIQNVYTCSPNANDLIIYDSISKKNDSFGNYPFSSAKEFGDFCGGTGGPTPVCNPYLGSATDIVNWIKDGYYSTTTCGSDLSASKYGDSARTGCSGGGVTWYLGVCRGEAVSFNSGSAGLVNITLNGAYWVNTQAGGTCVFSASSSLYLWDTVLDTLTLYGSSPITVNFNLIPDRNYWMIIPESSDGTKPFGVTCGTTYNYTSYNMSISAYVPNLNCSSWSACEQNVKQRTCNDLNGVLLPYVETQICAGLFPDESVTLGFESGVGNSYTNTTWQCAYGAFCSQSYILRNRNFPLDWTLFNVWACDNVTHSPELCSYIDDVLDIVPVADAPEGANALKLWNIPPSPLTPTSNVTGSQKIVYPCSGRTSGVSGIISKTNLNNSFYIARNITAYSPIMSLFFQYKKCEAPEQGQGTCFPVDLTTSCYTYNGDCNITPTGIIYFKFTDTYTGLDVYKDTISVNNDLFRDGIKSALLSGLIFNRTYQLTFAVPNDNPNPQDPISYCAYIDNVQIQFRSSLPSCTSDCYTEINPSTGVAKDFNSDGIPDYTYIQATPKGNACDYKYSTFDPICVPSGISSKAQQMKDGTRTTTCDGNTSVIIDPVTEEYSFVQNSPICIAEQEAAAQQNSYTTPMTGDTVVNTVANLVAMPIFFSFIIAMGIGAYVAKETKFWQIGVIFSLGLMTVFSLAGMFPIWFLFIVAIFAIAMFAYMMKAPAG